MTGQQRQKFAALYDEYKHKYSNFGRSQANIKTVCLKARECAKSSVKPSDETIDLLIRRQGNGIANVGRSAVFLQRGLSLHASQQNMDYVNLLSDMFAFARTGDRIDQKKYGNWKERFFAASGDIKLEVIFNRLVFAIFPEQFCSVPKPERLFQICNAIQDWTGVQLSKKLLANMDWFELCELIVPVVREALQDKDYAARSTFLATVGIEVSRSKGNLVDKDKSTQRTSA